jgi:hypothetical protein
MKISISILKNTVATFVEMALTLFTLVAINALFLIGAVALIMEP